MDPRWRQWLPVASLLLLAFAWRLTILFSLEGKPLVSEPILDSASYDAWAQEIATKSFWGDRAFYQDPLYPYALGLFYKVFGRHLLVIKVIQALIGVLGLWFLFEGVRRCAGYGVALATLAIGAVYRTTAFYDVVLLKEFLGPFFLELAFLAAVAAFQEGKAKWWLLLGTSLGLSALVRANLAVLPLGVAAVAWAMKHRRGAGLVVAGFACALLPVTVRNAVVAGEFVPTTYQFGPNLYTGNNPENWTGRYRAPSFVTAGAPEFEERDFRREAERRRGVAELPSPEVSAFWRQEAWQAIRDHPGSFLAATFRRVMLLTGDWEVPDNFNIPFLRRSSPVLWFGLSFGLVLWPLAAAGLHLSWIERRKHVVSYVLLAGSVLPIAFLFVFGRYRLPAMPLLFFFAGYAVVKGLHAWKVGMRRVPVTAAVVAGVVLIHANLPPSLYGVGDTSFFAQHYNLAYWHRAHHEPASAALEMDRAFQLKPEARKDPRFAAFAADCNLEAGRAPEALELRLGVGDDAGAARVYLVLREPSRAADHFAKAVARDPANGGLWLELSDALVKTGRHQEALQLLGKMEPLFQDRPEPALGRAKVHRALGMWAEAASAADAALRKDPGLAEARQILDEALARLRKPK